MLAPGTDPCASLAPTWPRLARLWPLSRRQSSQLDVFFIGNDGRVYVSWVVGIGAWNGPVAITPPNSAFAGGDIVAATQVPGQTDVFYVGTDGAVRVLWATGNGGYAGPTAHLARDLRQP